MIKTFEEFTQINEAADRFDSKYFVRNVGFMMDDFAPTEIKFIQELLQDIERYHPDGDISRMDVERLARDNEYNDRVNTDTLLSYIWDSLQ